MGLKKIWKRIWNHDPEGMSYHNYVELVKKEVKPVEPKKEEAKVKRLMRLKRNQDAFESIKENRSFEISK